MGEFLNRKRFWKVFNFLGLFDRKEVEVLRIDIR